MNHGRPYSGTPGHLLIVALERRCAVYPVPSPGTSPIPSGPRSTPSSHILARLQRAADDLLLKNCLFRSEISREARVELTVNLICHNSHRLASRVERSPPIGLYAIPCPLAGSAGRRLLAVAGFVRLWGVLNAEVWSLKLRAQVSGSPIVAVSFYSF